MSRPHRVCLLTGGILIRLRCTQAVFTVLPVRFARALAAALRSLGPRAKSGAAENSGGGLQGDQLFDLLCVLIFGATVAFLRLLPAGTIYFWLKDLTQEFLKLHVIHSAVEIFDKARAGSHVARSCRPFVLGYGTSPLRQWRCAHGPVAVHRVEQMLIGMQVHIRHICANLGLVSATDRLLICGGCSRGAVRHMRPGPERQWAQARHLLAFTPCCSHVKSDSSRCVLVQPHSRKSHQRRTVYCSWF